MWAAPWAGVMLASGPPVATRTGRGSVAAWLAGIVAGVPFWQQSWYAGPLALAFPQLGDVSFFVAFVVAYGCAKISVRKGLFTATG
jgi:NCS1 family nucleobase:cation symporter-1